MYGESLSWWCRNLSEPEAQVLLIAAAKAHSVKFTDPTSIGMSWCQKLRTHGFEQLPPYARNFLAHEYLKLKNAMVA